MAPSQARHEPAHGQSGAALQAIASLAGPQHGASLHRGSQEGAPIQFLHRSGLTTSLSRNTVLETTTFAFTPVLLSRLCSLRDNPWFVSFRGQGAFEVQSVSVSESSISTSLFIGLILCSPLSPSSRRTLRQSELGSSLCPTSNYRLRCARSPPLASIRLSPMPPADLTGERWDRRGKRRLWRPQLR